MDHSLNITYFWFIFVINLWAFEKEPYLISLKACPKCSSDDGYSDDIEDFRESILINYLNSYIINTIFEHELTSDCL